MKYSMPLIFKASFEKDNRSTIAGYRGPGLKKGLSVLKRIKEDFGLPVLADVHRESDIEPAADVLDVIQIPAFLCQQTSLLVKAGLSDKVINIKKGQFLAPQNMSGPVSKVLSTKNNNILLTERGTCFGYNRLVSDVTCIPIMQQIGFPVVYDATHIVRIYGIPSRDTNGGMPEFIENLACAGVAAGCDALFLETHTNPRDALCDAASMLPLEKLPALLEKLIPVSRIIRSGSSGPAAGQTEREV